jgi:predicted nucleic acid-binding protein
MSPAVLDTNVLIFDTFEDSEFHSEAVRGLDSAGRWYIPSMVFDELLWFFKGRDFQLGNAKAKLEEYLTNEKSAFAACTIDDVQFATERMKTYREYNDLIILSVAGRLKLPLFSFDAGLRRMAVRNAISLFEVKTDTSTEGRSRSRKGP